MVSGTKQWVCPGCSQSSFWTFKQCRHCQRQMPGHVRQTIEKPWERSDSQQKNTRDNGDEYMKIWQKRESNDNDIWELDKIKMQLQDKGRRGCGRRHQSRRCIALWKLMTSGEAAETRRTVTMSSAIQVEARQSGRKTEASLRLRWAAVTKWSFSQSCSFCNM